MVLMALETPLVALTVPAEVIAGVSAGNTVMTEFS